MEFIGFASSQMHQPATDGVQPSLENRSSDCAVSTRRGTPSGLHQDRMHCPTRAAVAGPGPSRQMGGRPGPRRAFELSIAARAWTGVAYGNAPIPNG
jgi:hypothetical protein